MLGVARLCGWVTSTTWVSGADRYLAEGLREHQGPLLAQALRVTTWLGDPRALLPLAALAGAAWVLEGRLQLGVVFAAAPWGAFLIALAGKHLVHRPRPAGLADGIDVVGSSLPSGHAALAAAFAGVIGYAAWTITSNRRVRALSWAGAATLCVSVGISRVSVGAHWPTDVLAGWIVGTGWLLTLLWVGARWRGASP